MIFGDDQDAEDPGIFETVVGSLALLGSGGHLVVGAMA